jgi:hypothetical protein
MEINEANQLTNSNHIFNWVKNKVIEGKSLKEIIKEPEYINLENKIKVWRENPVQNSFIPETFLLFTQVKTIYEQKLTAYTCFLGEYNIDYFIQKFELIPANQWCTHESVLPTGEKDVWGHCGHIPVAGSNNLNSEEAVTLYMMTIHFLGPLTSINDGDATFQGGKPRGNNPKDRIVNALKFFRYEMNKIRLEDMKQELLNNEFPIEKE